MLLNCDTLIQNKTEAIKNIINSLDKKPTILFFRVLGDKASETYINLKNKKCKEVGIQSINILLPENISECELINYIEHYNQDTNIDAILVQLPLPKHINERKVLDKISPKKDVDGLSSINIGKLFTGCKDAIIPCTPKGILSILKYNNINLEGKNILIINRSNIVGKPLVQLLQKENATITLAHSKTRNINNLMNESDIIITATGCVDFINKTTFNSFNKKRIIIDVSINRDDNNNLCGDVNKELYNQDNLFITPVPKGVGPLTILSLMENTLNTIKKKTI